jgi:hypothetical protein
MGLAEDRLPSNIGCLAAGIPFTRIADDGFHCDVWQSIGTVRERGADRRLDFVLKRLRFGCSLAQLRIHVRDHRRLRERLGEIVPEAFFIATRVDGVASAVVLARTHLPWFDLSNPYNDEEARELLIRMPRARDDLRRFVEVARAWRYADPARVIDLVGANNLVIDRGLRVRYLDSFGVFFYPDVLDAVDPPDAFLAERIAGCDRRLEYLAGLA